MLTRAIVSAKGTNVQIKAQNYVHILGVRYVLALIGDLLGGRAPERRTPLGAQSAGRSVVVEQPVSRSSRRFLSRVDVDTMTWWMVEERRGPRIVFRCSHRKLTAVSLNFNAQ